ncbi:acetylxylan esterase [Nonomuraea sp. NPDC046570]|uniref:acetylxylan esterase n=1 Tax=Nonomuraea sp. NPDC046570 TaxID=3155255 RepID=UPI0033DABDBB
MRAQPTDDLVHDFPFDPTYGYDLDALLAVPAPEAPDGFDDFWRARHAEARAVDVAAELGPVEWEAGGFRAHGVTFTSTGGFRLGGWLTLPADGNVVRGLVSVHGYSGRDRPEPETLLPGTAAIWPCARGIGARSLRDDLPAPAAGHVLQGIGSRETYIHGGCAGDVWCAATALLHLVPEAAGRLGYSGISFGGGIGALALPWDDRFRVAALVVPSFGQYPLRLTMPCVGSGEAVRTHHAEHPEVVEVLRYFDAATASTRTRIPVHVGAALFDPAVQPPGQFAVYNALAGPKELFVTTAGHFEYPGKAAEKRALLASEHEFFLARE